MNLPPTGEAAVEEDGGRAESVSEDVLLEPVGYFKISAWFHFLQHYLFISISLYTASRRCRHHRQGPAFFCMDSHNLQERKL